MKVLFIQNNGIQESIGVSNISAILKANGHQCGLLLVSHTPDLIGAIRKEAPDLIALSALTGVHQSLVSLAARIKKSLNIPIIMGGPHPTYSPQVLDNPGIDMICQSEGEFPMLELADKMARDQDITDIKNLHVKTKDGVIHKNPLRLPINLDDLPPPDRELYYKYDFLKDIPMKRFIASMGCPYICTFCHESVMNQIYEKSSYVRRKSVSRVIDEIKYIRERYPLEHVHFSDDLFFIRNNYKWLEEFAEHYSAEVGLPFTCNIRFDSVNDHAGQLMRKANAVGVAIGLETGNERLREKVIKKRIKNEHIIEGARYLRKYGIKILTNNMIGLPGETLDEAFETVALNMQLKSNYTRATTFMLFPGLPMVDYAKEHGFVDPDFDIEKHVIEGREIVLKIPYAREFKNISALFPILVRFSPKWIPFFRKIVSLPDNLLFRIIGAFNVVQELLFFRVRLIPGLRFFKNTILASSGVMTLQSVGAFFKRKEQSITTDQLIHETDRGLF